MKKGFTILELLVAALLLGMLMMVLTMIFNQSSISWRIGEASIADLDDVSDGISSVRYEADNLYVWNNQSYALLSPWVENGTTRTLRKRAIDATGAGNVSDKEKITKLNGKLTDSTKYGAWGTENVGTGDAGNGANVYTVNVMSAGPNRKWDDWDDIWSFPDEFQ